MAANTPRDPDRAEALRETLTAVFGLGAPYEERLRAALTKVPAEDVADVLGDFDDEKTIQTFRCLPDDEARSVVIEETDQQSHDDIIEGISKEERLAVFGEMPVDDLVDHLEERPPEEKAAVLAQLEPEDARDVEELSQFGPETAGGLMTTEFLSVPLEVPSNEALATIQGNLDLEVITYVYVVDEREVLRGVVSIRDILRARPQSPIREYITAKPIAVNVETDQEEVAAVANKYNLDVVPVVDDEGRIRGIVTNDDIQDAVEEEHSEDMLRMAGTVERHPYEPVVRSAVKRLPFLFVTMIGGLIVIALTKFFVGEELPAEADHIVAVVAALPLLCALSGNVAIVASTVMVRGLATGEINLQRSRKAISHEVLIGFLLAIVLSIAVAVVLWLWNDQRAGNHAAEIAVSVACGLFAAILWAALIGSVVPIACRLSGRIDPAIASGPFVTMLCDVSAAFIFLYFVAQLM